MTTSPYERLIASIEADKNRYKLVFYSPRENEICLVKSKCRVDGIMSVDRTDKGCFGHYQSVKLFLKDFFYVGVI